jgi:hypothetical protein
MFFLKNSKIIDGKNLKYILKKSEKIIFLQIIYLFIAINYFQDFLFTLVFLIFFKNRI